MGKSQHGNEIAEGRLLESGEITLYLCTHNHWFLVFGPHVFCKCRRDPLIMQKPEDHCGCAFRREASNEHTHPDGSIGYVRSDMLFVHCSCSSPVKKQGRMSGPVRRAAQAAYLVGGYAAAADVIGLPGLDAVYSPNRSKYTYDHDIPDDFPAGK